MRRLLTSSRSRGCLKQSQLVENLNLEPRMAASRILPLPRLSRHSRPRVWQRLASRLILRNSEFRTTRSHSHIKLTHHASQLSQVRSTKSKHSGLLCSSTFRFQSGLKSRSRSLRRSAFLQPTIRKESSKAPLATSLRSRSPRWRS